jgi:hypothetical protein
MCPYNATGKLSQNICEFQITCLNTKKQMCKHVLSPYKVVVANFSVEESIGFYVSLTRIWFM